MATSFAARAKDEELCDILYNDITPVDLGHAKVQSGRIDWTDLYGKAMTYNDPPYWVQSKIKRCKGPSETAATVPVATPLGPEAFGVKCRDGGDCSVSDTKVFHHFVTSAKKGDAVQFEETKDKVQFTYQAKSPGGAEGKKNAADGKKSHTMALEVPKDTWTSSVEGKGKF
jgi:hypothetical protein